MSGQDRIKLSKWLSWVLRHEPAAVGLVLQENGWVAISDVMRAGMEHGQPCSKEDLLDVVRTSDKQRFAVDGDELRIRANQGHSSPVVMSFPEVVPPMRLFHGTATRFIVAIRAAGLVKGQRHHVHLSADVDTARVVGSRHGRVIVLTVDAQAMYADGHRFWRSENGVWLADAVPTAFLIFPNDVE